MCTKGAEEEPPSMFGNEPKGKRGADKQVAVGILTPSSRKKGQKASSWQKKENAHKDIPM